MASCQSSSSFTVFDTAFSIWKTWQISVLMLLTMALQALLVVAGMMRRHSPNRFIHLSLWMSFVGVDTVATYVLGLMVGTSCDIIFSLWAPIVLFHLGAADSITAWSSADNDMWQRQAVKMSIEVLAVLYIVIRTVCHKYLVIGALLFVVGVIKYAERVSALRSSSSYHLLKSAQPICKFMGMEHEQGEESSPPLLVMGEHEWYSKHVQEGSVSTPIDSTVTYQDIVKCRELKKITHGYMYQLCLAYALYKVFKRRLANLRLHHNVQDYQKVRKLLKDLPPLKLIRVIDLELSFIFEGLFTKAAGSAYTQIGVFLRILIAALLIVAVVYLLVVDTLRMKCTDTGIHLAGVLTHVLLVVAVILEAVQITRMITSNWTKVWLGCTYIKEMRRSAVAWAPLHRANARLILCIISSVGAPKNVHWKDEVGQISIVDLCLQEISCVYLGTCRPRRLIPVKRMQRLLEKMADSPCHELELFVLERLGVLEKETGGTENSQDRDPTSRSLIQLAPEFSWASDCGLEQAILNWHIATCICELSFWQQQRDEKAVASNDANEDLQEIKDAQMSVTLSKYVMYLFVKCPSLLPGGPDVATLLYRYAKQALKHVFIQHIEYLQTVLLQEYNPSSEDPEVSRGMVIDSGIILGRQLLTKPIMERWRLLANVWCEILVLIAISEDANPHKEQLAKGGELLTHLWVLLDHIGFRH